MRKQSKKFLSLCLALVMALGTLTFPAYACTADKDGNITPCEKVEEQGYCDIAVITGIDWDAGVMYQWPNPYYKEDVKNPAPTGGTTGNISGEGERVGHSTPGNGLMPADEFFEMQIREGYNDIVDYDNWTIYYVDENGQTTGYKVIDPEYNDVSFFYPDGTPVDMKDRGKLDFTAENPFATIDPPTKTFDLKNVPDEGSVLAEACYTMFEDVMPDYGFDAFSYGPEYWTVHTNEYDAVFDLDTFIGTLTYTDGHVEIRQSTVQKPPYWMTSKGIVDTATGELLTDAKGRPIKHFDDVKSDAWYYDAVTTLATNGILNGYPDGLFHPDDNVTIGEMAVIIYQLATGENPVGKNGKPQGIFYDNACWESDHWAAYAINTLDTRASGYLYKDVFRADEYATRADAIKAVYTLASCAHKIDETNIVPKYKYNPDEWDFSREKNLNDPYTNTELQEKSGIPDLALDPTLSYNSSMEILQGVMLAYQYGIVHGTDAQGSCHPNDNLTRAELCQMIFNAGVTEYSKGTYFEVDPKLRPDYII